MAKRKRLSPAAGFGGDPGTEEQMGYPFGVASTREVQTPPVARIAGDAATRAALDELADTMRAAREGGRMIVELPLDAVEVDHLTRDRLHFDAEDMAALKASLRARGQQTPIEVVTLAQGRYGLISGARRMAALADLRAETGEARFGQVLVLIRPITDATTAYLAMVEENEIRSPLSFYERARLADEAARLGLYDSAGAAVKALFVHAPAAKRSKILNFVALHRSLGTVLRFPEAIPEKLGLALAKLLEADNGAGGRLQAALEAGDPQDAAAERAILEATLAEPVAKASANLPETSTDPEAALNVAPGVLLTRRPGRVLLTGKGVDETLLADLVAWLESR